MLFICCLALSIERCVALHQFVKINLVAVQIRPVNTGKLRLSGHLNTAAAAHACAVHHDRIQRNQCFNAVRLWVAATNFIMIIGDRDDFVILIAGVNQLLELVCSAPFRRRIRHRS